MQIENLGVGELLALMRTANETMTRVILLEMETVGPVERERVLIVEPLSVEVVVDA